MTQCQWIGKNLTSGRLSLCFLVWLHTIKVVRTVSALAFIIKKLKELSCADCCGQKGHKFKELPDLCGRGGML